MIPVLFNKNEQQFRTYGLGEITDIINPKVTRERNGQYLLYFQYPQNAKFSDVFEEDMRIKSDAGVRTKWQTFEISRVIRKEGQLIEVFAKHISQSLLKDALNPSVNVPSSNAQQALNIWNNNRIGDEEFDVWSDITITNSTSWNIREVSNAFEALAGVQGSILDVWGGEYEFDNKTIRLHKEMGRKSPVPLEYGRNITGLEQDQQEYNIYTSIYPFAVFIPEGVEEPETITLPEYYVDGKYLDMYPKRKIQVVDFSGEFGHDDIPTVDRLRALANQYAEINEVGLPHENLKVEYIDLSKTLDYQEFQTMEEVELNDRLPIFYPKFGITNESAKVVVINYDPVKEENISIELGVIGQSFRTVTTGGIGSRLDKIEKQQDATNNYVVNNKGNRIWFETPDEDMEHKIGDTWFEKNGPYDRIRVWNGNQWETIIDSEDIDKNADAIAEQQKEIEDAKEVADEALNEIDQAVTNAGFTSLSDLTNNLDTRLFVQNQTLEGVQTMVNDPTSGISSLNTQLADLVQIAVTGNELTGAISVLNDNINLRVQKGDVINQINISDENILIQSDRILLDGDVTVSGTSWLDGAVIANASIDGAKIEDATIGSAKIASLDASKISTGTLDGIQITGVTITGSTFIQESALTGSTYGRWDRTGITMHDPQGLLIMDMNRQGLNFHGSGVSHKGTYINNDLVDTQNLNVYNLNVTGEAARLKSANFAGDVTIGGTGNSRGLYFIGQSVPVGYDRMIWAGYGSRGDGLYTYFNGWRKLQTEITNTSDIAMNALTVNTLTINNSLVLTNRLTLRNTGLQFSGGSIPNPVDRQMWIGYGYADNGIYVSMGENWHKHGATISDERLKKNIVETATDSLTAIKSWEFVEFEWRDSGYGSGRKFGLIAQNTSHIAHYYKEVDRWEIDSNKQTMMNSHAIQQLALREQSTNTIASQALQLGETNEEKIKRLEKRIEELECAA